jgi:hypothetical protein
MFSVAALVCGGPTNERGIQKEREQGFYGSVFSGKYPIWYFLVHTRVSEVQTEKSSCIPTFMIVNLTFPVHMCRHLVPTGDPRLSETIRESLLGFYRAVAGHTCELIHTCSHILYDVI